MDFFTRRRLADLLGVSRERTWAMQRTGAVAPPEEIADGVEGWTSSYAASISGQREKRRVSESVFGLPPAAEAARITRAQVFPCQKTCESFAAIEFVCDEGNRLLLLHPVFQPAASPYRRVPIQASPNVTRWDDQSLITAIQIVAGEWVEHNPSQVTWLWSSADHYQPLEDIVVEDLGDHHLSVSRSGIRASTVAQKLGLPVPHFPAALTTERTFNAWILNECRPVEVEADPESYVSAAHSAVTLHELTATRISTTDRILLVQTLLQWIHWDASGTPIHQPTPEHWEHQLLPRFPEFADHYRPLLPEKQADFTLDAAQAQDLYDQVEDELTLTFGPYGTCPSVNIAKALEDAQRALHYIGVGALAPRLWPTARPTYVVRSFTSTSDQSLGATIDGYLDSLLPSAGRPPHRALQAESISTTNLELLEDSAGNAVTRRTSQLNNGETLSWYSVAVPGLRQATAERLADFTAIHFSNTAPNASIILTGPFGARLMPLSAQFRHNGFSYGYGGSGPGRLWDAICQFLEAADLLGPATEDKLRNAIESAPEDDPLVIPRAAIL